MCAAGRDPTRMPTADEITQQQKAQWSAAASGWEQWGDWFDRNSGNLAGWLCDAAGLKPGQVALDLACGAGQPSATAARRVLPGGRIVATDLSPEMVAVTRRTAEKLGLDNLEAREMDMQALTFADGTFDAATCRFGLMFCPDPVKGASEIRRVLKPGARFATAVWDVPAKNPFFTSITAVLGDFVPLPPPDPAAPGVFRLAPPGELARVLTAAGFSNVAVESRPITLTYGSLDEYWQIQTGLAAPLRAAIASLSPDKVDQLKARLFDALAAHRDGDAVTLAAVPLCASATR
ncbi:MAG: putative Ubiquinone/menaquinone biosynthesis methyltransferase UbiE [Acidobacteria bacterium]|nr:putative Ubiquinone/menaquinone biosynthesis methyltransferase UbiE [Acidobacteriota bacterium]